SVLFTSREIFPLLGARAAAGRLFTSQDETEGHGRVAVVSDTYFERRFHRDPSAIGKTLTLGGNVYVVTAVLPPKFFLPATSEGSDQLRPEVFLPLSRLLTGSPPDDTKNPLMVMAQLKPGVSLTAA